MFKEWLFRFICYIIAAITLIAMAGLGAGALIFIVWIGMNRPVLGISIAVVLGLIGLGLYAFFEVKNER
jgi:hypothetical protein